jgi:hypothetical protein
MPDGRHICETEHAERAAPGGMPFRDLRFAEQFVVWSMRKWVDIMRSDDKDPSALREVFVRAKVSDAFDAFDYLMRIVACSAKRTIDVRCVQCGEVSPDESLILGLIEAGQHGDAVSAHMYLDEWVPTAAARIAFAPASFVAEAMDRAGIRLSGNRDRHLGMHFNRPVH